MIAYDGPPTQPRPAPDPGPAAAPLQAAARAPRAGPVPYPCPSDPVTCPTCGHTPAPYDVQLSAMIDTLLLLEAVLHDLKHQVEEMAS